MNAIAENKTDTELFQFGDHKLYFVERDNPENLTVTYDLRCKNCRSYVRSVTKLHNANIELEHSIAPRLFKCFKRNFLESCEENRKLSIVRFIHDI